MTIIIDNDQGEKRYLLIFALPSVFDLEAEKEVKLTHLQRNALVYAAGVHARKLIDYFDDLHS